MVSSTYFHCCAFVSRSLIIRTNNHGPSLVPCGTPAGTGPHSEKHSDVNLIRWDLSDKKKEGKKADTSEERGGAYSGLTVSKSLYLRLVPRENL